MIFSVASTCLSYAVGLFVSTLYIRKLKLVGAGFFWMMYSTIAAFLFLGIISSVGSVKVFQSACLLITLVLLINALFQKASVRKRINKTEIINFILLGIAMTVAEILLVAKDFNSWAFVRELSRLFVGGILLGCVTSAMLLGHWYLVQPGLTRKPIARMCKFCLAVLVLDVALWLIPTSMVSVISGSISDGWGGTLGYMWLGSCITSAGLIFVAHKALAEKSYSAVMATTGLLYLAILVVNGVELIPRAIFS